jgi:hypothetical protein
MCSAKHPVRTVIICVAESTQRVFDEHLNKRIGEIKRSQLSTAATLDSSLHRIHTDMHQLAGRLFAIVERLENRLEELAKRVSSEGHDTAGDGLLGAMPACSGVELVSGIGGRAMSRVRRQASQERGGLQHAQLQQKLEGSGAGLQAVLPTLMATARGSEQDCGSLNTHNLKGSTQNVCPAQSSSLGCMASAREAPLERAGTGGLGNPTGKGEGELIELRAKTVRAPRLRQPRRTAAAGSEVATYIRGGSIGGESPAKISSPSIMAGGVNECDPESIMNLPLPPGNQDRLLEIDTKLAAMDKKLSQMAGSMGIHLLSGNEGDDDTDDRKRLKEKLKLAIEADRRSRVRTIVSQGEMWLEYIFGICRPDQRLGKSGSR